MSETRTAGLFTATFTYTDAVLSDFEAMYRQKKEISPAMRIVLGALGAVGAVYFGWMLYRDGLSLTRVGYVLICAVLLVVALSRGGKRPDESTAKYRKYYQDRQATFKIDENGVEMHLEGQKNYARSKFREIYGLFDTDMCFYFVIKGKAYYILPKDSVEGAGADELKKYMEKKCAKHFLHYDTNNG